MCVSSREMNHLGTCVERPALDRRDSQIDLENRNERMNRDRNEKIQRMMMLQRSVYVSRRKEGDEV